MTASGLQPGRAKKKVNYQIEFIYIYKSHPSTNHNIVLSSIHTFKKLLGYFPQNSEPFITEFLFINFS